MKKNIWKQKKNDDYLIKDHYYGWTKNGTLIDLTLYFGEGNEPKDSDEFTTIFDKYDTYKGEIKVKL